MTEFAVQELQLAVDDADQDLRIELRLPRSGDSLNDEGFRIEVDGREISVVGGAAAGAMYEALELAEQPRLFGPEGVESTRRNPYFNRCGNPPLDKQGRLRKLGSVD